MNTDAICIERLRQLSRPLQPQPTGLTAINRLRTPVRCLLFDIYGTLFISGSGDVGTATAMHQQVTLDEALSACDWPTGAIRPEQITAAIQAQHAAARQRGVDYPEINILTIWQRCLEAAGLDGSDPGRLALLAVEYEARTNPVWPMPGLIELLTDLQSVNLRLGIISNAQFYTPLLFPALTGRTHTEWGFEPQLCVWSWQCGAGKPSPSLFQQALAALAAEGVQPAEVLYVGNDMRNDIGPSAALGCHTALFAGDQRSLRLREEDEYLRNVKPDIILTSLIELSDSLQ